MTRGRKSRVAEQSGGRTVRWQNRRQEPLPGPCLLGFCGARQKRRNRWWLQRPIRWRKVAVRLLQQYRPCQPMWVVVRGMRVLT